MAFNLPDYNADKLSFGPGVVLFGVAGETPGTDVGAVDEGMTLTHAVEVLDVLQGAPRRIVKSFRLGDTVTFAFAGFEWTIENFPELLGAGHVSGDEYGYGGDLSIQEVSLRLRHNMPPKTGASVGSTLTIDIFRARSNGDLTLTFGAEIHSFPATFTALQSTEDWAGNALDSGEEYYKMTLQEAP